MRERDISKKTSFVYAFMCRCSVIKGKIENENSTYIATIKKLFSHTSDITEKVAIGIAVKAIPALLGIS